MFFFIFDNKFRQTVIKQKKNQEESPLIRDYQAKLRTPFAVLGIRTDEDWLTDIDYLPINTLTLPPQTLLAKEVCRQLSAYLTDPNHKFDLSLHISGTIHQQRVWKAIMAIPGGETSSYAAIAAQIHSAPRAVGRACGANRIPIVIPCHRVISKNGALGGFMNASAGDPLEIKRWLLGHESV
ncbi:methylated-DNA--[protein]-cysteine S-methyltransferase [Nitrosomonas sp.]|uniref:methylated-DNA--[protein]-cysteine S-methyltransferase n=1 Tax=Nitrosomonas sp. TaxID=42353 RepID=UPI001D75B4EB|nr:methylated-DNA--[protein]-cysteine S-methyltransferase [Nitrosomonas sp.]MBX3618124.1 methylated-DNA--[protein]-cysteine S-methyltransferase [Nitrosomonas sp.]